LIAINPEATWHDRFGSLLSPHLYRGTVKSNRFLTAE
jgi:hypothetical protein